MDDEDVDEEEAEEDREVMDRWPCDTSMESCVEALCEGEYSLGRGRAGPCPCWGW